MKYDAFFLEIAAPIIEHEEYQKMKGIRHHHGSVYEHSLSVAYLAYRIAVRLKLDVISTIRGALLHDFYLYKFKKRDKYNLLMESFRHSRNHPKIACANARKYFDLNKKEQDIISNHMFPVGLPRSSEAWVTTLADKSLAIAEYSIRMYRYAYLKVGIRAAEETA
ncbi:HD domain-containing protein [Dehalobacter sp. DCM]|uniref:HD domain-containing protein n=1 Tax=Dehalobacter sp. DCM TaxID=2907827 RepID=UPI00308169D6|nr:HD domain-containing protein [Dehalobacter sp. DCM]